MTENPEPAPQPALKPGQIALGGQVYMKDPKGALVPVESIKPVDSLTDEMVRKIIGFAKPLAAEVARFKQHTLADFADLQALLAQQYGVRRGGVKGNVQLVSFDGLMMVKLQVADLITFGPELQQAKALVDEYLVELTADAHADIRAIITRAFNVDQQGKINRAELFSLRRLNITDDRWVRAMQAIDDSIRPLGTKEYIRFYERDTPSSGWRSIIIDVAA